MGRGGRRITVGGVACGRSRVKESGEVHVRLFNVYITVEPWKLCKIRKKLKPSCFFPKLVKKEYFDIDFSL